jgi:predicted RNase H-like HicB family nuclease
MTTKTFEKKIRLGRKDDSDLHELYWEMRREREARGLPPENDSSNPEKIFAEWRRKLAADKSAARQKDSPRQDNRRLLKIAILVAPLRAQGYWAYCPTVNGKRWHGETMAEAEKKLAADLKRHFGKLAAQGKSLPKTTGCIKKIKIAAALA